MSALRSPGDKHATTTVAVDDPHTKSGTWAWRVVISLLVILVATGIAAWATDFVVMQGEWTIYTATCEKGEWKGSACTGTMKAAERFRFRSLKAHREVLFWTVGDDKGESGRYTQCTIQDGRNWSCPPNDHVSRTITRSMVRGVPAIAPDAGHLDFHAIPKWKWEALRQGIPVGSSASN